MTTPSSLVQLRPRERAGDRTRARVFEAALAEFRRVGFEQASIARIAEAAGISRPTFYFHFPTKEHVLLALQWNLERETVDRLAGAGSLRETLERFVDAMIDADAHLGECGLLREILILHARRPPPVDVTDQVLPLVEALGRHFSAAASRGDLRGDLEPGRAAHLCLMSVFGYLIAAAGPLAERRDDLRSLVSLYLSKGGGGEGIEREATRP